jgi:hypothetical protein
MTRANPFNDLGDFAPKAQAKPVEPRQIDQIASDLGFPSRQPSASAPAIVEAMTPRRRRYTTGRNQQLNVKATAATVERFYRLADHQGVPLGELLEQALQALEKAIQKPV